MAQNSFRRHISLETITNEHLYLCHFGWHKCQPGYSYGPAIRQFYLIHFITAGKGTYTARGNTYALHAGQSFIIHPDELTSYQADTEEPWTYYYFSFNGAMSPSLLRMTGFRDGRLVTDIATEPLVNSMHHAVNHFDNCPNKYLYGLSVLGELLGYYAQDSDEGKAESSVDAQVAEAKNYIEFNYSDKLSVDRIAAHLNISRSQLYKIFKKETGISPMEYITQCRIRLAAKLLETTDLTVAEIANAIGFDTYSSFFRAFQLTYGHSPRAHRGIARKEAPRPSGKGAE